MDLLISLNSKIHEVSKNVMFFPENGL